MFVRGVVISLSLALAACGGDSVSVKTAERLEQVENNCGMLAAKAALETGETAPSNFCYCMVQLLEESPDVHVDAISQTLTVVAEEHDKSGDAFADIAMKLHEDAASPDASDRSVSLGIGIKLVEELSSKVDQRAKGGRC